MTLDQISVLVAIVGAVQTFVMMVAGFYVWIMGRERKQTDDAIQELKDRVSRLEQTNLEDLQRENDSLRYQVRTLREPHRRNS